MPQKLIRTNVKRAGEMAYGELGEVLNSPAYTGCIVVRAYDEIIVVIGNEEFKPFLTTFALGFTHDIRILSPDEIIQLSN